MSRIDPNLTFEFGPPQPVRQFVISAGGIRSSFPEVTALARAAPCLKQWELVAFRPRRTPTASEIGDKCIDPADVAFTLLDDGTKAGINLFLPGFKDDDTAMKQIGYLLLDEALGEYDVETGPGLIRMLPPEASTDANDSP